MLLDFVFYISFSFFFFCKRRQINFCVIGKVGNTENGTHHKKPTLSEREKSAQTVLKDAHDSNNRKKRFGIFNDAQFK